MQELEALLKWHDDNIEFDHLNNHIRCYLHIINICSSHIIASSTRIPKQFLKTLKTKSDSDLIYPNIEGGSDGGDNDSDNDDDDDDDDDDGHLFTRKTDIPDLKLDKEQLDTLDNEVQAWYRGLKHDPIKHTRRIVHIMRSSDQRRQVFKNVINTGNDSGWFMSCDNEVIELPDLELLHDVKTQWDSVYYMIERLLVLRPVSVHMYGHRFHSYC